MRIGVRVAELMMGNVVQVPRSNGPLERFKILVSQLYHASLVKLQGKTYGTPAGLGYH